MVKTNVKKQIGVDLDKIQTGISSVQDAKGEIDEILNLNDLTLKKILQKNPSEHLEDIIDK